MPELLPSELPRLHDALTHVQIVKAQRQALLDELFDRIGPKGYHLGYSIVATDREISQLLGGPDVW